jgi:hypothetical protein
MHVEKLYASLGFFDCLPYDVNVVDPRRSRRFNTQNRNFRTVLRYGRDLFSVHEVRRTKERYEC